MKSHCTGLAALVVVSAILGMARTEAAPVVLGASYSSTSPDLSTALPGYTVLQALNFGGAAVNRNGINFTAAPLPGPASPQILANSPFTVTINSAAGTLDQFAIDAATDNVFLTEIYGVALNDTVSVDIAGLNPLATYNIYFLHGENRQNLAYTSTLQTFTDSSGSVQEALAFDPDVNRFAIQGVQVSGSSFLNAVMPSAATRGASFSGLVIQQVPEPGTGILLLMGCVWAGRLRKRFGARS